MGTGENALVAAKVSSRGPSFASRLRSSPRSGPLMAARAAQRNQPPPVGRLEALDVPADEQHRLRDGDQLEEGHLAQDSEHGCRAMLPRSPRRQPSRYAR